MFDVGPEGCVRIGAYAMMNEARIICDSEVEIGPHTLLAWNVVIMDSYRVPFNALSRRHFLQKLPTGPGGRSAIGEAARPIRIGSNVWIGFDCCVLPGVTIGDGSVIGARSVVTSDIPAYAVAAGNPARVIRHFTQEEIGHVKSSTPEIAYC
jgi:acetyltransferase-like isoleucine patch superfamily enzyme